MMEGAEPLCWFERLPEVELHVHLEGAIPHSALWELIGKYGGDPSVPDLEALRQRFKYRDFAQFIKTWSSKNRFLREYEDFTLIAEVTARDLAAQNIRYAERIGHGTRAREDPSLVECLAEKQIPLEMCPLSNVQTGVVNQLSNHPIRQYFEQGIAVTVNTDDPTMSNTSLAKEYQSPVEECGFSRQEICGLVLTAIESSWTSPDRKQSLRQSFVNDPSWID